MSVWQKKVIDCLPQTRYEFEPGTQYLYSNIGYASLGLAIERAAARRSSRRSQQRILQPLGMSRSAFEPTAALRANLAHGYVRAGRGRGQPAAPGRELDGRGYRVPNGAMFSTINDLGEVRRLGARRGTGQHPEEGDAGRQLPARLLGDQPARRVDDVGGLRRRLPGAPARRCRRCSATAVRRPATSRRRSSTARTKLGVDRVAQLRLMSDRADAGGRCARSKNWCWRRRK